MTRRLTSKITGNIGDVTKEPRTDSFLWGNNAGVAARWLDLLVGEQAADQQNNAGQGSRYVMVGLGRANGLPPRDRSPRPNLISKR
jgi:hypothetical protein